MVQDCYAPSAEFYDYSEPYRMRADIAYYVDAAVTSGGPVLEVGCGTGRVLIPTLRAGIPAVGLDASEKMLAICRERLMAEPNDVRSRAKLVQGDMRSFDLPDTFKLVTIPFRSFQHLETVEDQMSCLAYIRRHLEPGGRLAFDVFNPSLEKLAGDEVMVEVRDQPAFYTEDGRRVERWHRFIERDKQRQVFRQEFIYRITYPDGREERQVHPFSMRHLFRYEVEHLLVRCGFKVEHIYADFDKKPYGSIYPGELVIEAVEGDQPNNLPTP